jgi:YD repeat-containing protein
MSKELNTSENLLTLEYLKQHKACSEGIVFFKRNGLEGFPLDQLQNVKGDFNSYVEWLKERPVHEYDSKGNMTKEVYPDGRTYCYEYDSKGNKTKLVHPNGRTYCWEYDSKGNKTKSVYPDGDTYCWEYTFNNDQLVEVKENRTTVLVVPLFK